MFGTQNLDINGEAHSPWVSVSFSEAEELLTVLYKKYYSRVYNIVSLSTLHKWKELSGQALLGISDSSFMSKSNFHTDILYKQMRVSEPGVTFMVIPVHWEGHVSH